MLGTLSLLFASWQGMDDLASDTNIPPHITAKVAATELYEDSAKLVERMNHYIELMVDTHPRGIVALQHWRSMAVRLRDTIGNALNTH